MKVNIQYYGMIAELIQKDAEELLLNFEGDSLNLKKHMESIYPALKKMTYQIAVNQELKESISTNDQINEIAILPPFAGG